MSVREEDKQKTSCPSRGLGLAAAAIGVGVGAALYYFFSKRPENPDGEGSTSNWRCEEQPQALPYRSPHHSTMSDSDTNDSQYSTISENTTTDTSMDADRSASETDPFMSSVTDSAHSESDYCPTEGSEYTLDDSDTGSTDMETDSTDSENGSDQSERTSDHSEIDVVNSDMDGMSADDSLAVESMANDSLAVESMANDSLAVESMMNARVNVSTDNSFRSRRGSESEIEREWDITNNSLDVPRVSSRRSSPVYGWLSNMRSIISPGNISNGDQMLSVRDNHFRERSWSLEECSICCEVMLNNQELRKLPCTHNFHAACIDPWLEEQQTCPNCRKQA